ncbi:hypothetical protein LTR10_020037 [Elasticomyces elasticus]|uniref:Integral membrane protein n=1 Tax=Exophiala sideris TaxID=1016849 RepID=A0ABR0JN02_9EURO|nr:hypothetical protein LTR10_020037 [Elasticomyces elasticus]KAK5037864.1 hypothetical protein LTS07_001331 [Exophiala sideris]KAK5043847.1 hypothetical protein LTR13_000201 [Exophiala sideris]KAK5067346.1 hypothetical protein LTR69_001333 [Exophiala sideris]KAK5182679.1 hypothetical protein LTR44_005070 [Eurotiomycetes sp. CCFEE 6388]
MASSRSGARRTGGNTSTDTEPFPSMPDSSYAGPSSYNNNTTTTTTTGPTTTVTTTVGSRGRPYTVTSSQPGNAAPTTVTSSGGSSRGPSTRTTITNPTHVSRLRPIGIRRLPSNTQIRDDGSATNGGASAIPSRSSSLRGRSTSAPQHLTVPTPAQNNLTRQTTRQSLLPTVTEGQVPAGAVDREAMNETTDVPRRRRSVSNAARSVLSTFSNSSREREPREPNPEYDSDVLDLLDVLDPEVSTLTTLNNVQNSLFVPDLGRWINRRPTYTLSSRRGTASTHRPRSGAEEKPGVGMTPIPSEPTTEAEQAGGPEEGPTGRPPSVQRTWSWQRRPELERTHSITSVMTESHYAVLPHGVSLNDWSEEDKEALDDHVRHMMHSKRSKFKYSMIAFGKYIKKPLGFFVTLYATLITLFGLAWVLFLIGWIYVGDKQGYDVNVIDNVLVALFAVVGDGLAPFRAVDTYHMCFIAHYHHLTWRLRREKGLPKLQDHNDLPSLLEKGTDPEAQKPVDSEFSVLSPQQQQRLIHHQAKFSKSHSFYKPHETATHYAFPLRLLVAIVVLLDCHSLFQIALGTCTWSISYHHRPQALTATILSCSITVNITAGILISIGDRRTRKKDVALKMQRQQLTAQALKKVEGHRRERSEQQMEQTVPEGRENFEVIDEETAG